MSLSALIFEHVLSNISEMTIPDIVALAVKMTLKQVAHDHHLSYSDLKTEYIDKPLTCLGTPPSSDLEETEVVPEAPPKSKSKAVSKSKEPESKPEVKAKAAPGASGAARPQAAPAAKSYAKMKKDDLVSECEDRGLSSDGTCADLRERLKTATSGAPAVKEAPAPKEPKAVKAVPGAARPQAAPEKKAKAVSKKSKSKLPKPVHSHALTEEIVDGCGVCETYGNAAGEEEEDTYDEIGLTLGERLKRMLKTHGGDGDGDPNEDAEDYVPEEEGDDEL